MVDLEAKLLAALEEIESLRKASKKHSKEISMIKNQLVEAKERKEELTKKTLEMETEIKTLQTM